MHAAVVYHGWAMWDAAVLISSTCEKWRNVLREQKVHIPTSSFCVSSLLEQEKKNEWWSLPAFWGSQEGVNTHHGCASIGWALHIKSNIYEWRSDVPLSGGCPRTVYKIQPEREHGQVELQPDIPDVSEMWHSASCLPVGGVQPSSPLQPRMLLIAAHWVIEAGMSGCLCSAALTHCTANNRKPASIC